ncbi:4'-phosphopantetheinyl transferase family protein [Chromobacterium violaceum]|uniref:4'-phosphopantetheinyl transferase family protein n=1 Tax=Chromobacterium violaceum TaxID=536 RepID=UPI00069F9CFA|nr:4'-phosphopantetheinyl transferase superfamily protein [Chromobacterium violaceum]
MWVDSCPLSALAPQDWVDAEAWLGSAERLRLSTMLNPSRRRQFLAARWLLRRLASQKLGMEPKLLGMDCLAGGAPFFPSHSGWFPAISHTDGRAACALAKRPVGLDLETPRPHRSIKEISEWLFSPSEQEALRLETARLPSLFLRMWTLREAWLKQRGRGLDGNAMRSLSWDSAAPGAADSVTMTFDDGTLMALSGTVGQFVDLAPPPSTEGAPSYWRSRTA